MAVWGGDIVWARDVGADKQKVRDYLVKNSQEVPYFRVLVRMFDLLWKTEEERESVIRGLYNDCAQRRGNYGTGV